MTLNFVQWQEYFRNNVRQPQDINWEDSYCLTDKEQDTISHSIQIFQKGESSEGQHLLKKVQDFASSNNCISYYHAFQLFLEEEHRHSRELGLFMSRQNIPKIKSHEVDSIFTALRRMGSVEMTISVLVCAEIIATAYYSALSRATKSENLRTLCKKILEDEAQHINFQAAGMAMFYGKRGKTANSLVRLVKRLFLQCTILVVWTGHKSVFKAGGFSFTKFKYACLREFNRCENMISKAILPAERTVPASGIFALKSEIVN